MTDTPKEELKIGKGKPGPGRPRKIQVPEQFSVMAGEAFQNAYLRMGATDGLVKWAKENPTEFYKLFARLIPVQQQLTGANGDPMMIAVNFIGNRPS